MNNDVYIRRSATLIVSAVVGAAVACGWGAGVAAAGPADSSSPAADSTGSDQDAPAGPAGEPTASDVDTADSEVDPGADAAETNHRSDKSRQLASPLKKISRSTPVDTAASDLDPDTQREIDADAETADVSRGVDAGVIAGVIAEPRVVKTPTPPANSLADLADLADPPKHETTDVVAGFVATALHPISADHDAPEVPAGTPAEWTLLAAARRDIEVTVDETRKIASSGISTVASEEPLPSNWEDQYLGRPSLIHQLVVTGLHVVDIVLKPFGGLLSFTSLKVPLFTDGIPPFFFRHGLNVERTEFEGMPVWTLEPKNPSEKTIVALHGGAYVATASLFHWWTYTDMARDTGATVIVPLYRLVPDGGTAAEVVPKTTRFLEKVMLEDGAANVSVIGDSAGGGLALAAVQQLVAGNSAVPSRMVLFAPWLDATMSHPLSTELDPGDPLLDVENPRKAGEAWGDDLGAADPSASPLFGSLEGLPPITVYSGSLDLVTPDTLRLQRLVAAGDYSNFTFNLRKDLLHDWFIFGFLPEAHAIRPSVYAALLGG
jgi:acetyl esterase/lipase